MAKPDRMELRQMLPSDLLEAMDMIALAHRMTRAEWVEKQLMGIVVRKQHEASLIEKSPRITPMPADSSWGALE